MTQRVTELLALARSMGLKGFAAADEGATGAERAGEVGGDQQPAPLRATMRSESALALATRLGMPGFRELRSKTAAEIGR